MSDDVYDVEGGEGGDGVWGDGEFGDCEEVSLEADERERPLVPPVVGTSDDAAAARGEGKSTGGPTAHASAFTSAFTNAKAGMEGVDRDKVKRIVHEMSKDSSHFQNESRKEQAVEDRIREMRKRWAELCNNNGGGSSSRGEGDQLWAVRQAVEERVAVLEARRNLTKTWIHVDMDAFFAAVHELERPELRLLPVAVGGLSMISTANYTARKFGVRSAMPAGGSRPCIHTRHRCSPPRLYNTTTSAEAFIFTRAANDTK